jgi:putative phosphoesterase
MTKWRRIDLLRNYHCSIFSIYNHLSLEILIMVYRHTTRTINLSDTQNCLVAAISDTHGKPHPNLFPILERRLPSIILHAGDLGGLDHITELERISQTVYVRGNVDPTGSMWPDSLALQIKLGASFQLDLLLLHIAVARLRLIKNALNLLRQHPSQIVVFGHSHMPFLGMDGKIGLFNPGSAGPSRMGLPTTMGLIEISSDQLSFKHLDLKTGEQWKPGMLE